MQEGVDIKSPQHTDSPLSFLWLEITGRCNLSCVHCYAESGPFGQADRLGTERWLSLLAEGADLGVQQVQFIGGEPTIHPNFSTLVAAASDLGLGVEVYSNLTHIRNGLWNLFEERQVKIATSFYSRHENAHDAVTQGRGSQARTLSNIRTAIERGLQLRVGIVDINRNQDVDGTVDSLRDIGVRHIRIDRTRGIGRAGTQDSKASAEELCGHCAKGRLAIDPAGWAYPCVFSRWLPAGNVGESRLEDIASSPTLAKIRADLTSVFHQRRLVTSGGPEDEPCDPDDCDPDDGGPCDPLTPCEPIASCIPLCDPLPCIPHA